MTTSNLPRVIGVSGVAFTAFNCVVGVGIFGLPGIVANVLGPAAIVAYLVCLVLFGLIALCLAEAGSRVSGAGGLYAYASAAFGPVVGGVAGMLLLTQIEQDSSYWLLVFPAMVVMSVGLAGVFIPAASTSLVGVESHDAGVASAVLNTSQQIGGSLGTALLNTLFAGAVTSYFVDHPLTGSSSPKETSKLAFLHGYHVSFFWGAVLLAAALVVAFTVINAKKQDVPTEAAAIAA